MGNFLYSRSIATTEKQSSNQLVTITTSNQLLRQYALIIFNNSRLFYQTLVQYTHTLYENTTLYVYNLLKNKYNTNNDDILIICDICMNELKTVVLIPCGHLVCKKCVSGLLECHICRGKINGCLNVYF